MAALPFGAEEPVAQTVEESAGRANDAALYGVSMGIVAMFFPVWFGSYLGEMDVPAWVAFMVASAAVSGLGLYRSTRRWGAGRRTSIIGLALTLASPIIYTLLFASFRR